jgi:hypothetical protein
MDKNSEISLLAVLYKMATLYYTPKKLKFINSIVQDTYYNFSDRNLLPFLIF